jgi:hypothetical protein
MLLMKNVIKCWRVLCLVVMLFSAFFFFCFSERFVCISHTRFCQSDTPNYLYLALIPQPHNGTLQDFLWPSHQHREHGKIVEYKSVWNTNREILTYSKHLITKFDWKDDQPMISKVDWKMFTRDQKSEFNMPPDLEEPS